MLVYLSLSFLLPFLSLSYRVKFFFLSLFIIFFMYFPVHCFNVFTVYTIRLKRLPDNFCFSLDCKDDVGLKVWSMLRPSKGLPTEIMLAMLRRQLKKAHISNKLVYLFDICGYRSGRYYDYGYNGCRGMKCSR